MSSDAPQKPGTGPEAPAPTDWRDRGGLRHPYALYIFGVALLFLFLVVMGYFALDGDWIPNRGITQPSAQTR